MSDHKPPTDEAAIIGQRILRAVADEEIRDVLEALENVKAYLVARVTAHVEHCAPPGERQRLH